MSFLAFSSWQQMQGCFNQICLLIQQPCLCHKACPFLKTYRFLSVPLTACPKSAFQVYGLCCCGNNLFLKFGMQTQSPAIFPCKVCFGRSLFSKLSQLF